MHMLPVAAAFSGPNTMVNKKGGGQKGASRPECNLDGIAQEWDTDLDIRKRIRDGGPVLNPETTLMREDIKTCCKNADLLVPLCVRMCQAQRKIPSLDSLRDEVAQLLTMNKRTGQELVQMVEDSSQHLKKLLVFIKTKARRHEVSTATGQN